MASNERHMFPGANTPIGFFSYFEHIIPAKSARHIFCMKGGPGVGKSTFMRRIGDDMLTRGKSVEFIHCSSDPDLLDGIVIPEFNTAFIDGTDTDCDESLDNENEIFNLLLDNALEELSKQSKCMMSWKPSM